jgi:ribonuclease HI
LTQIDGDGFPRKALGNLLEVAAIQALEFFTTPRRLAVYSDSNYLIKGMNEWLPSWVARGWRKRDGKAPDNRDLWERLRELAAQHAVTWHWVKGHSGNPGNEQADQSANRALAAAY